MASALKVIAPTKKDIEKIALFEKAAVEGARLGRNGKYGWLCIGRSSDSLPMGEKLMMKLKNDKRIFVIKRDRDIIGYGATLARRDENEIMDRQSIMIDAALSCASTEYSNSAAGIGTFVLGVLNQQGMRTAAGMLLKEVVKAASRNPHIKRLKGVVPDSIVKAAKKAGMGVYSIGNGIRVKIEFEGKECEFEPSTLVASVGGEVVSLPSTDFNRRQIMLRQFLADPRNEQGYLDTPSA